MESITSIPIQTTRSQRRVAGNSQREDEATVLLIDMYRTPVSGVLRRKDSGFAVRGENPASVSRFAAKTRLAFRSLWRESDVAPKLYQFRAHEKEAFGPGQASSFNERDYPRNRANADSKAVTPISPAAQKFRLFILCSDLDSSVTVSNSSAPGLTLGKRHIADANQNIAEPHAAIITAI